MSAAGAVGFIDSCISQRGRGAQGRARFLGAVKKAVVTEGDKKAKKAARGSARIDPAQRTKIEARVYNRDVVFKVRPLGLNRPAGKAVPRGEIKGFSRSSARRLRFMIRNTADMWDVFLTLTYPGAFETDGRKVKAHVNAFCQFLRRRKIAYVWVLEFQKRGAPHFHFLLSGFIDKKEVARRWFEIVGSGDERHLAAGTRIESVKNPDQVGQYMSGYLGESKEYQKTVPAQYVGVGRFWGASRCLSAVCFKFSGVYGDAAKALRTFRAAQKAATRHFSAFRRENGRGAYKWRWRGFGFTLVGGASIFKTLARQAVMIDRGVSVWDAWDGKPDGKSSGGFVPHWARPSSWGQLENGAVFTVKSSGDYE